jgi:fatty acid desaturase
VANTDTKAYGLPPSLKAGKEGLSKEGLAEVMALNGARPAAFLWATALAWLVIAAAIWAAVASGSWVVGALAVFVVASRQNVLGLLIHEQTHLGLGGKYGDWIANALCAYPLLAITVDGYAQLHLTHHRDYFKATDPDFIRKSGDEWTFPKRPLDLLSLFIKDLLMINTIRMIKGKKVSGSTVAFVRRNPTPKWLRPLMLVGLAVILTWMGTWLYFLLFWVLPLVSVMPVFVRWGAICEHEYNTVDAQLLESTPLIVQTWWERLLMPNLNFGMHPYHHIFPGVSFSELPKVHKIFQREGLVNEGNVFYGNAPYLKHLVRRVAV